MKTKLRKQVIGPWACGNDQLAAVIGCLRGYHLKSAAGFRYRLQCNVLAQDGPVFPRKRLVGGVAFCGRRDSTFRLIHTGNIIANVKLGKTFADFRRFPNFIRNVAGGEAFCVVGHRNGWILRPEIESACFHNQLFTRIFLHRLPGRIGLLREAHVTGCVIRQTDDAGMVLRFAADVSELELLQSKHFAAGAA